MSSFATPLQPAATKVVGAFATSTPVTEMNGVVSFASNIDNTGYGFDVAEPGTVYTALGTNAVAESFKSAIAVFEEHFQALNWSTEPAKPGFDLAQAEIDLDEKIDPRVSLPSRVYHAQQMSFSKPYTLPPADQIVPILAAPSFKQPMYEVIRDLSKDLLIPNLDLISENAISLLETNQKFIESFMVGLNHEMGRELLWREYPTDQRGTYFKHFWDATDFVDETELLSKIQLEDKIADIPPIHLWPSNTPLGTHNNRSNDGGTTPEAQLVLVIRGDLLKKYPDTVIYAQKAAWVADGSGDDDYSLPRVLAPDEEMYPIFGAEIDPDISFFGFDLTACEAKGDEIVDQNAPHGTYDPGYFFVIKERPGEPRFGLDIAHVGGGAPAFSTWNDARWDHVGILNEHIKLNLSPLAPSDNKIPAVSGLPVTWNDTSTAADIAMATFQNPVLVAIHAQEMLSEDCS
jgi:hypothetical protein